LSELDELSSRSEFAAESPASSSSLSEQAAAELVAAASLLDFSLLPLLTKVGVEGVVVGGDAVVVVVVGVDAVVVVVVIEVGGVAKDADDETALSSFFKD
jgi:hypothetical protein